MSLQCALHDSAPHRDLLRATRAEQIEEGSSSRVREDRNREEKPALGDEAVKPGAGECRRASGRRWTDVKTDSHFARTGRELSLHASCCSTYLALDNYFSHPNNKSRSTYQVCIVPSENIK